MKIGSLKRNDVAGALAAYKAGANTRDDVDMLLSLQDDPSILAKEIAKLGRLDYDEDQPRDEGGRFSSTGGGGGLTKDESWKKHRAPLGTGAPRYWTQTPSAPTMSRAEGKAKAAELRAKAEHLRDEQRAGRGPSGENSYWHQADRIEKEEVPAALRAGYTKEEVVDPDYDDIDMISQPGHLYRGIETPEYEATVAKGEGLNSDNRYSAQSIEGMSFGYDAGTAYSYVNNGSGDPVRTGKPTYLVEVKANDAITYNNTAGYPQSPVGAGVDHSNITRMWKVEARDGKRVMTEVGVPPAKPVREREAEITKGNIGIPREEMPQIPSTVLPNFLDQLEDRGWAVRRGEKRSVSDLKPTQATMNMEKVERLYKEAPTDVLSKPIVVSSDNHILDGHHRWAALKLRDPSAKIETHYVGMPIKQLVEHAQQHPDSIRRTTMDAEQEERMKTKLDSALKDLQARLDDIDRRIATLKARNDYDEDQPRGEDGRWSSSGGGGGKSADDVDRELTGAGRSKSAGSKSKEPSKGLKELSERLGKSYVDLDKKGVLQKRATRLEPKEHAYMKSLAGGKRMAADPKIERSIASKLGVNTEHLDEVAKDYESSGTFKAVEESRAKWQGKASGNLDTKEAFEKDGKWAPERVAIREKYIKENTEGRPTSDTPTLYMTGGGPASGKTSGLLKNEKAGIPDTKKAAHINADEAKEHIPEYKAGKEANDAYAASFVHEESSDIAKKGVGRALKDGHDVVFDSTGDSGIDNLTLKINGGVDPKSGKRVIGYREQGAKRIVANYAVIDVDEAIKRSDARAEKSGRFVPHSYLRANHADVARTLVGAVERKLFDKLDIWDTTADGKPPTHVATFDKAGGGLKIHSQKLWDKMVARGKTDD